MAFKEVLWCLQKLPDLKSTLTYALERDKRCCFGIHGDMPGNKNYIPADATIGGL